MSNSKNITWHAHQVSKEQRAKLKDQKPCILWFTGLSGSGKSTIANAVEQKLNKLGKHTYLLDGDNIRMGLNKDLGFAPGDRVENIRRIGEVCKLFVDAGLIVLSAFISPYKQEREGIRDMVMDGEFIEVFVDAPLEVCQRRDPKGLYEKVKKGEIENFTGISSPYEAPENAQIHIKTDKVDIDEAVEIVLQYLQKKGYF